MCCAARLMACSSHLTGSKLLLTRQWNFFFFKGYQTGFPSGPLLSYLSWTSRAGTALLPSSEPPIMYNMCSLFLFFVQEETSIPHKRILWVAWNSWRSFPLFICRTKIHAKLDQGVCFILLWKLVVVEKTERRRMEKGQGRGYRGDCEPGKDSVMRSGIHMKLE